MAPFAASINKPSSLEVENKFTNFFRHIEGLSFKIAITPFKLYPRPSSISVNPPLRKRFSFSLQSRILNVSTCTVGMETSRNASVICLGEASPGSDAGFGFRFPCQSRIPSLTPRERPPLDRDNGPKLQ